MANIREILQRLEFNKQERKRLRELMAEALASSASWVRIKEELDEDKARLKQTKLAVLSGYKSEIEELERLNREIKNDAAVLSDVAISMLMKGENINVETDVKRYEPRVIVSFKQMKLL